MFNNLGPRKTCDIPLEIYDENGEICIDINQVLDKWRSEYNHLYNFQTSPGVFDDEFRDQCENDLNDMNDSCDCLPGINDAITLEEVAYAISVAKPRKAVGIDHLPNEILKNENTYKLMHVLFSQIFEFGVMPTIWKSSIIKPIPKSILLGSRLSLQYRGISLLSTVYKIFSFLLNRRISNCIETNDLVADEQNGFRQDWSCLDRVYSLTSIIRCRKIKGLSTYVAFIDLEKAFDRVHWKLSGFSKSPGSSIPSSASDKTTCLPRNAKQPPHIFYKRFKTDKSPENFCESDFAQKTITELIHRLESHILSQNQIDKAYDDLCAIYYSQIIYFFDQVTFTHVLENVYTGVSSHFGVTNCNLSGGISAPPKTYIWNLLVTTGTHIAIVFIQNKSGLTSHTDVLNVNISTIKWMS